MGFELFDSFGFDDFLKKEIPEDMINLETLSKNTYLISLYDSIDDKISALESIMTDELAINILNELKNDIERLKAGV